MSLLKIRDMSLLRTPPRNRLPIETFIGEFREETIKVAIEHELSRGGQVFYLHNRIQTLEQVRRFLSHLIPRVRVDIAHGRMESRELEEVMHRFIHGGSQVLLSTSIIENGIDIPNVNTMIIDRADMYGLSQLYQLRGRVGRADKPAYAYLLYPEERVITEAAMKRLKILSEYTDLGSGFKIAMKDLEVRGAGNLLGREQHGDILAVGFDMYIRLLDEAIAELREEKTEEEEVYLELDYSGYVPDSYISDPSEKMEVYKRIVSVQEETELQAVFAELEDRFGPMPEAVQSLLSLAEIRVLCRRLHISALRERKKVLEIEFGRVSEINADKVVTMIQESGGSVRLDPKEPNILHIETGVIGLKEKSEFIREKLSTLM
jgi:transcription-repair coupling factor (superfamily II helicase)